MFLMQLGYIIGEDILFKGLKRYYNEWKFKHPDEYDFIRIIEKESRMELDWYIDYWIKTTHTIDYSLEIKEENENEILVSVNRLGKMPMPIEIEVMYEDSSKKKFYIPLSIMRGEKIYDSSKEEYILLDDWEWVNNTYEINFNIRNKKIIKIEINPSGKMADIDQSNNKIELD